MSIHVEGSGTADTCCAITVGVRTRAAPTQYSESPRRQSHREVAIQPADRTLTDEDFDALTKRIVANVEKSTGGVLRG